MYDLERFLKAQETMYPIALQEMAAGRKDSHWMWYIFPQLKGLGFSSAAKYYGITCEEEAIAYLNHPVLGERLLEITKVLLKIDNNNAEEIMGYPDHLKLQSCMTLFARVGRKECFTEVLVKFFDGKMDERTLEILRRN